MTVTEVDYDCFKPFFNTSAVVALTVFFNAARSFVDITCTAVTAKYHRSFMSKESFDQLRLT